MDPRTSASAGVRRRVSQPAGSAPRPRAARPAGPRAARAADPWWLRVRWDRVQRTALVLVLCVVVLLYIGPLHSWFSAWRQAAHERSVVSGLERQHEALVTRERALHDPATLERAARALGMVRPDERSYVVTGLPGG